MPHPGALTANGKTIGENCASAEDLRSEGDPHRSPTPLKTMPVS